MNWRVLLMSIIRRGNLLKMYKNNLRMQYEGSPASIECEMRERAMTIFKFHVASNSKYRKLLDDKGFDYSDLERVEWADIPMITKDDLRKYYPEVESEVYNYSSSGGSTNAPFRYPASRDSALAMWPNHWMLHDVFGSAPYGKSLMLMAYGESKKGFVRKIYHRISNFHTVNSFSLNEKGMYDMYKLIAKKRFEFIYGYSSAINQFLLFLKRNQLHIQLKGIVCTSDNMLNSTYALAREFCGCDAYNQYGAHDGDIFSFECQYHEGLHINHQVCSVEVVDNEIVVTATQNRAFPFIRYRVGDITEGDELIKERCKCGRTLFRLKNISGRTSYMLETGDGEKISTMIFTHPFDDDYNIDQYQVVERGGKIVINFISAVYNLSELEGMYLEKVKAKLKREVVFQLNGEMLKLKNGKIPLFIKSDNHQKKY